MHFLQKEQAKQKFLSLFYYLSAAQLKVTITLCEDYKGIFLNCKLLLDTATFAFIGLCLISK